MNSTKTKPSEAPLANSEVPEQDGSEDPGSGMELVRDPVGPSQTQKPGGDRLPEDAGSIKTPNKPASKKGI